MRWFSANEAFMQAYPPVRAGEKVAKDLFDSL
jgi:hypothetical protein